MGRAEISYKQTSKSAAELKQGNKIFFWLGPGLGTHGYLSKLDFFWPSQFMWGKSTPALLLVYIFFALHHAPEAHERVLGQHTAGVGERICNLANMVNYTNIACVDAPMWYQQFRDDDNKKVCVESVDGYADGKLVKETFKKKQTDTPFQSFAYVYWTFNTLRKNTGVHNCSFSPTFPPSLLSHS